MKRKIIGILQALVMVFAMAAASGCYVGGGWHGGGSYHGDWHR